MYMYGIERVASARIFIGQGKKKRLWWVHLNNLEGLD